MVHSQVDVRRWSAIAAVGAMVASLLAVLGLTSAPAFAADAIAFRAGTQSAANLTTHRVTIPAAVRETDGMLLFVTKNNAAATISSPPPAGPSRALNGPTRTPRPRSTARSRSPTTPDAMLR